MAIELRSPGAGVEGVNSLKPTLSELLAELRDVAHDVPTFLSATHVGITWSNVVH
jgi:hypothetical protein